MKSTLPGPFKVVEGDSTTLYIDDEFGLQGGRDYYLAEVRHGDPDELARHAGMFAASRSLLDAAIVAERLLDSVAFVAKEGDSAKALGMLRAAIRMATALPAVARHSHCAETASYSDILSDGGMDPRNAADASASRLLRPRGG
jgi:hypothetical protein